MFLSSNFRMFAHQKVKTERQSLHVIDAIFFKPKSGILIKMLNLVTKLVVLTEVPSVWQKWYTLAGALNDYPDIGDCSSRPCDK